MSNIEQTILDLDSQRMKAMTENDVATLKGILADDLTYTHTSAAPDTKQSFLEAIESGRLNYQSIEPSDVKVRAFEDTAVVTGSAQIKVASAGNELSFGAKFIDVYANRDGRWQMIAWQATRIPE